MIPLDSNDYKYVLYRCNYGSHEYKGVLNKLRLEKKLLIYSFSQRKLRSREEIVEWCNKIGVVLGFDMTKVEISFHGKRKRAAARCWAQELLFGDSTTVHGVIHEFTHLMDTTEVCFRSGYRQVHKKLFTETLVKNLDKVAEHAEELGLKIYSAAEILEPTSTSSDILGKEN